MTLFSRSALDASGGSSTQRDRQIARQTLLRQFAALGRAIAQFIAANDDPKVTFKTNHSGQKFWIIYDPISRKKTTYSSEDEVRSWLDHRYQTPY